METNNHPITDKDDLQTALIQKTLASWRFFLFFSMPPLIWALFTLSLGFSHLIILLFCALVWISCWRLWLDEGYFRFINKENNELAGEILYTIWNREKLQQLTFIERQQGALKLCQRTMLLIVLLWIIWLIVGLCI